VVVAHGGWNAGTVGRAPTASGPAAAAGVAVDATVSANATATIVETPSPRRTVRILADRRLPPPG
jgi:hypothetical protein